MKTTSMEKESTLVLGKNKALCTIWGVKIRQKQNKKQNKNKVQSYYEMLRYANTYA